MSELGSAARAFRAIEEHSVGRAFRAIEERSAARAFRAIEEHSVGRAFRAIEERSAARAFRAIEEHSVGRAFRAIEERSAARAFRAAEERAQAFSKAFGRSQSAALKRASEATRSLYPPPSSRLLDLQIPDFDALATAEKPLLPVLDGALWRAFEDSASKDFLAAVQSHASEIAKLRDQIHQFTSEHEARSIKKPDRASGGGITRKDIIVALISTFLGVGATELIALWRPSDQCTPIIIAPPPVEIIRPPQYSLDRHYLS